MPPTMTTAARIPAKAMTLTRGVSVRSIAIPIGTDGVPLYENERGRGFPRPLVNQLYRLPYWQLAELKLVVATTLMPPDGPCLNAVQPPTSTETQ